MQKCAMICFLLGCLYYAGAAITVIPRPKQMVDQNQAWTILAADNCAIVIGASASAPESYAAVQFQKWMQKRFGRTFDIMRENEALTSYSYIFLLGTRTGNAWLDQLVTLNSITLSTDVPGYNGYVIQMVNSGAQKIALVGGSDPSGVVYGQNTLFQLCENSGAGSIKFNHANIRDWPSIRRRGSHINLFTNYLAPDMLDLYVSGRFNTADLRNSSFGGEETSIVDSQAIRYVTECHQRGFYVWGSMSVVANSPGESNAKIQICDKYLNQYGVNGVWANVDDPGAGSYTETLIDTFIKWGIANGLQGSDMMLLGPQNGGYEGVRGEWNQTIQAHVPASKNIQWVYTGNPDPASARASDSLGLAFKPYWWVNSPGSEVGLTFYPQYGNRSYPNSQMAPADAFYRELQDFKNTGWTVGLNFETEPMSSAANYINGASLWVWSLFQEEYAYMNLGCFLWDPAKYVFAEVKNHIYETVFGKERAMYAAEFDSCLTLLKTTYFDLYVDCPRPPALMGNRQAAEALAQTMCQDVANIKNNPYTVVDSARYHDRYEVGMEKAVKIAYDYLGLTYNACSSTANVNEKPGLEQDIAVTVFPNPFNPTTTIRIQNSKAGSQTSVRIYDIHGKMIWDCSKPGNQNCVMWDGRNMRGIHVSSGAYFIKIQQGNKSIQKAVTILK